MKLIDREESAECLLICQDVHLRMIAKGIYSRKPSGTVPPGILTCGDLINMVRSLMLLAFERYPELLDPDVVESLIRSAAVRGAGGSMN